MDLSPAQKDAINSSARALKIVACAGSGKTEVLARRVVRYLLEEGMAPESIVAFTFTEKAAGELKVRIDQRASEGDPRFASHPPSAFGLFAGTIHSYCLHLLQSSGKYEIHDVLTEEREWALLYRFARRLGLADLYEKTWPGTKISLKAAVDVFLENLEAVHGENVERQVLARAAPDFAAVLDRYDRLVSAMKLISFDQIILNAVEELRPGGVLRGMVEGKVKEVLVDEYQDLNRAQECLLSLFLDMGANLTVVGDDDQAIYQWRGGDVALFLGFDKRYGAKTHEMGENRRSRPSIVRAASAFALTINDRVKKEIRPGRSDEGPCVELLMDHDAESEARTLTLRIKALLADGHAPGDIAVLYRSVRTSAGPLIQSLKNEGIPASVVGRVSLLDRPETRLVARALVFIAGGTWRPDDEPEVVTQEGLTEELRELTGASAEEAAIGVRRLAGLRERLVSEGVKDLARTYMTILAVLGLPSGSNRERQERGLGAMSSLLVDFEHALRRAAPEEGILAGPTLHPMPGLSAVEGAGAAGESIEALQEAVTRSVYDEGAAAPGQTTPVSGTASVPLSTLPGEVFLTRLRVFLEKFASQAVEETSEGTAPESSAVNIMTIHQAKGLEFPVVIVPSLVEGRFPSSKTGKPKKWYIPGDTLIDKRRYEGRLDDERRLFYVAMTRAKELLILSTFRNYKAKPATVSTFLRDLLAQPEVREQVTKLGIVRPKKGSSRGEAAPEVYDCGQLLVYSECPRKYYLRYGCGFAPPIDPALGFGKVAHHVVCEMARRCIYGELPSPDCASEILAKSFYLPFAGPLGRERMFRSISRRVRRYAENHGECLRRVVRVEQRFEVPIDGSRLRGRIDLIARVPQTSGASGDAPVPGGHVADVEIIDVKSSENRPPLMQHKNQLRLYGEAARIMGMNPVRLTIHDLDSDDGTVIPVEADDRELDLFKDEICRWIYGIKNQRFEPKTGRLCGTCDFTKVCGT